MRFGCLLRSDGGAVCQRDHHVSISTFAELERQLIAVFEA
jgi:hypothetical protein